MQTSQPSARSPGPFHLNSHASTSSSVYGYNSRAGRAADGENGIILESRDVFKRPLERHVDGEGRYPDSVDLCQHQRRQQQQLLHLQSPAKIAASPAKGKGIQYSIVNSPPSAARSNFAAQPAPASFTTPVQRHEGAAPRRDPVGIDAAPEHTADAVSVLGGSGPLEPVASVAGMPRKRFDMSDWRFDLAAIASSDPANDDGDAVGTAQIPLAGEGPASAMLARYTPPLGYLTNSETNIPRTVLKPKRSGNLITTTTLAPKTAPQVGRVRSVAASRLPVPKAPAQVSFDLCATGSGMSASSPASTATQIPPRTQITTGDRRTSGKSSLFRTPASSLSRMVPLHDGIPRHHRRIRSIDQKPAQKHVLQPPKQAPEPTSPCEAAAAAASSFDDATKNLRQRHRKLSVSESIGMDSDADEEVANLKHGQLADGPSKTAMQTPGRHRQHGRNAEPGECASPFLDSPGRRRGSSLPFGQTASADVAALSALPPHPRSHLKSSRISYPPKRLDFDRKRNRDPLYSSVPAGSSNGEPTARPLDQLFLATILNSSSPAFAAPLNTDAEDRLGTQAAHASGILDKPAGATSGSYALPVGRKRYANGSMIGKPVSNSIVLVDNVPTSPSLRSSLRGSRSSQTASVESCSGDVAMKDADGRDDPLVEAVSTSVCAASALPPLSTSSSTASSLASSRRSSAIAGPTVQAAGTAFDDVGNDTSFAALENVSFSTSASEHEESSCFAFAHRARSSPGHDQSTGGPLLKTVSTDKALCNVEHWQGTPDTSFASTLDSSHSANRTRAKQRSPYFKNIRPLQAAFVNSGLLSKKTRPRHDRDSGVGLGGTPSMTIDRKVDTRPSNVHQIDFGTPMSNADLSFHARPSPGSLPANRSDSSRAVPDSVGPKALVNVEHLHMPDTPCKRPISMLQKRPLPSHVNNKQKLHPLAQSVRPSQGRSDSSCSTASDSSSVVNSIAGSASRADHLQRQNFGESDLSPIQVGHFQKVGRATKSPTSTRTGRPSASAKRADTEVGGPDAGAGVAGVQAVAAKGSNTHIRRMRPALFRRRSSGQLDVGPDGMTLSIAAVNPNKMPNSYNDWEPMTPTRTLAGPVWTEVPQLAISPLPSGSLSSSTPEGTPEHGHTRPMASPISPLSTDAAAVSWRQPLVARQTTQPVSMPRAALPKITDLQRPALRLRHSSSMVHTARQSELASPDRFATQYHIVRTLGQGEFSEAFEVVERASGRVSAIKRTKVASNGAKERLRRLEEVDALRLLADSRPPSPHVLSFYAAWEQGGNLHIETELCPQGDLAGFLEEYGKEHELLDEARVWKIAAELAAGVAHIHALHILHLDLKPANIFITQAGTLKIGDFGLATRWPRVSPVLVLQNAAVDSPDWNATGAAVWDVGRSRSQMGKPPCTAGDLEREGDREYIAPEVLRGQYGEAADMFSLGLIVLEAAANVVLPDNGLPWRKLRQNDFDDVDLSHLSDELVHVIVHLLESDPQERTLAPQLLNNPIVKRLQELRSRALLVPGDGMEQASSMTQSAEADLEVKAAVVEEADDFLERLFTDVRQAWHLHGSDPTAEESQTLMEIDG